MRLCLVTPCLNAQPFLRDCVESVVKQKVTHAVDHIIIDGGSTDGSVGVIKEYAAKLAYWESSKDNGMYHAIEKGFAKSDADIMGWLNSDDMHCPWTLQAVIDIFTTLPEVKFITSKFPLIVDVRGVVCRTDLLPGVLREDFLRGQQLPGSGVPATNFISQESTFWRRSLWEEAGGSFDHSIHLASDFELWARFLSLTELYVVEAPLAMFRPHGKNLSITQSAKYRAEAEAVLARYRPKSSPYDGRKAEARAVQSIANAVGIGKEAWRSGCTDVTLKSIVRDPETGRPFVIHRTAAPPIGTSLFASAPKRSCSRQLFDGLSRMRLFK
jgi:glycosyltransferase involved in cell wall biosynthesis